MLSISIASPGGSRPVKFVRSVMQIACHASWRAQTNATQLQHGRICTGHITCEVDSTSIDIRRVLDVGSRNGDHDEKVGTLVGIDSPDTTGCLCRQQGLGVPKVRKMRRYCDG